MESNPNRWRSPRYQGQSGPPWQSPQNRFRGGGGGDRFYSPRMSPRTPQNFSPYNNNNYNRNSPQFYNNSQRQPYQPRYSPNYRHRQNFYQSPGFHNQSPKSFGRQRGSNNWARDDIENWILPSMWEDPWADLRTTTCPTEKSYVDMTEASNDNTEDTTRPSADDEATLNDTDDGEKSNT